MEEKFLNDDETLDSKTPRPEPPYVPPEPIFPGDPDYPEFPIETASFVPEVMEEDPELDAPDVKLVETDPRLNPVVDDLEIETEDVLRSKATITKNIEGKFGLLELLSEAIVFSDRIRQLITERPDLLEMDEHELKMSIQKKCTLTLLRLRMSLWQEYESARQSKRKMYFTKIYAGICSEHVASKIIKDQEKLAFIICPPSDYLVQLKEAHSAGLNTLREILAAKVVDEDGYLLPRAADVVIKAFALLDMRLKGAIVQRIDSRVISQNQNVSVTADISQTPAPQIGSTMSEIDRQLENVKAKLVEYGLAPKHPTSQQLERAAKGLEVEVLAHNDSSTALRGNGTVYGK
jgi:hypothetical protein